MSIFKYYKFNKYSIDSLKKQELFCNHYQAFNDPFECWAIIHEEIPDPVYEPKRYMNLLKIWGYDPGPDSIEDQLVKDYFDEIAMYQPNINATIDDARITCFSETGNNPLMWAHYGDGLRGFCVEFDETEIKTIERTHLKVIPVQYLDNPPVVDAMACALVNDQIWYNQTAIDEASASNDKSWLDVYKDNINVTGSE